MQAFDEFRNEGNLYWSLVKFVSENLGYSNKKGVYSYSYDDIYNLCAKYNIQCDDILINKIIKYSELRAHLINSTIKMNLMDGEKAKEVFETLYEEYIALDLKCKIPLNKQKGDMKQIAYFTSIINIVTEKSIKSIFGNSSTKLFDDDPKKLIYILDDENRLVGVGSRRFDGAYPSTISPIVVWEIKEYYYTTTFGSRIADAVYETQLDGFEFNNLLANTGIKVFHVLFIDAYHTWWDMGKNYLCRIIDALNMGLVDEVIVGNEVISRWPEVLKQIIYKSE